MKNDERFVIGDRVRIQFEAEQKEYPYTGGGIIGYIKDIFYDSMIIRDFIGDTVVKQKKKLNIWKSFIHNLQIINKTRKYMLTTNK